MKNIYIIKILICQDLVIKLVDKTILKRYYKNEEISIPVLAKNQTDALEKFDVKYNEPYYPKWKLISVVKQDLYFKPIL